jgi:site-specific DNA recombinase
MPTRPRLAAVPDAPPRAVAYIRVSTARDDMVSPELQLPAIDDHCARYGYELVEVIEDLDLTARFWRRRQAERAVAMIEAHTADVIVLWKWSRLARNRRDWAVAIDRVEVAGGRLESATEPVDATTSTGRFTRGVLAELAAFESERTGDVWREVHARRVRQGLPANGKARFGYRVVDGVHAPDPETGPVLADLYHRYVAGESVYTLVEWLNRNGFRTVAGYSKRGPGPWTQMTLRRVLDTGWGAGYFTRHGERVRGVHEPIIDEATWTAYLGARAARRTHRGSERSQYLLSGLVRCVMPLGRGKRCMSPMGGGQFGHAHTPKYRCLAVANERRHQGGYVTMTVVESEVRKQVDEAATELRDEATPLLIRRPKSSRKRDAQALAREITALEKALTKLTVDHARGIVPDGAYSSARDEIQQEQKRYADQLAIVEAELVDTDRSELVISLSENWDTYSVEHRKALLRKLIERIEVLPGRPRSTVEIIWK